MPKTRNLPVKTYTLYGMGRICTHINGVSLVRMYTVSQKVSLLTLDNNFGKCGPIFKSLSPADSQENSTSPAICWYYTLWKSKIQKCYWFWQHPQQTVDMLLRTLRGLDLTFNGNLVRQTVSRLRTLTDWLTFLTLSDNVCPNLFSWTLLHHGDFFGHDYLLSVVLLGNMCTTYKVSITSSAITERPRDASCHWIFC